MPTPSRQLLSRTVYDTDGVTVNWDFSFSGGYLDRGHVKAYVDLPTGERTELTVTPGMFIGPYQLAITPAILSGRKLTIYRDTPKDLPLVDFTDGAGFSEASLDITAKQAVFVSAESVDTLNTSSNYEASVSATAAYASQLAAAASALAAQAQATASAASASAASSAAASINTSAFATAAQGVKADTALQPGSAASSAQGAKADTALQPAAIGVTVQAYDADIPTIFATQAEMEAGIESAIRSMSPLRVQQAIAAAIAGLGSSSGVPTGAIIGFPVATAPAGYIKANGDNVSRTTYAALFAVYGTTYGAGDGTTTFTLPDYRGEFPRWFDDGRGVDTGRVITAAQLDQLQGHGHTAASLSGGSQVPSYGAGAPVSTGAQAPLAPIADGAYGTPRVGSETRPRNKALLACIKT